MTGQAPDGILYVDAYDSFSNNITALLTKLLHQHVTVLKIDDEVADPELLLDRFAAVVIGPGPGHPENPKDIGLITSLWQAATNKRVPTLGICLGFQTLCSLHREPIVSLALPCHGQVKEIHHIGRDIFDDVGLVVATCYNSLAVKIPNVHNHPGNPLEPNHSSCELIPLAWDSEGFNMAVRHGKLPQWGLQFHPESCKSNDACHKILEGWWRLAREHNTQHRPHVLLVQEEFASTSEGLYREEIIAMIERVLGLTKSSGTLVQSRSVKGGCSAQDISELCYGGSLGADVAMLESNKKDRYSIYAMPSESTFRIQHCQGVFSVYDANKSCKYEWSINADECLNLVENIMHNLVATGGYDSVPFWGGFIGYLSYEFGLELLESEPPENPPKSPSLALMWTERSIIVDNVENTTTVQSIRRNDDEWLDETVRWVDGKANISQVKGRALRTRKSVQKFTQILPRESEYKRQIAACQQRLRAGDSYELCLTTEAEVKVPGGMAWKFYKKLRRSNPVPFAAYLHLQNLTIVSSSPEQFLVWDRNGALDMKPMKGTVRRSPSMTKERASEILNTPKEQAENIMIADLIRHDLYSAVGVNDKVEVIKLCEVIEHETVYQLVSHLRAAAPDYSGLSKVQKAKLAGIRGYNTLRCSLPPGSMTGAPKRRSCEILAELENRTRGVYSGIIGYLDIGGGGGFSVCIRSAFSNADHDSDGMQTWRIGAGGAITVLSDADAEWNEMNTKLKSVLSAFKPDQKGGS